MTQHPPGPLEAIRSYCQRCCVAACDASARCVLWPYRDGQAAAVDALDQLPIPDPIPLGWTNETDWEHRRRVIEALRMRPNGETKTALAPLSRMGYYKMVATLRALLTDGLVRPCQLSKKGCLRNGFRLTEDF